MAYYGPKTIDAKGDTVYYTLPDKAFEYCEVWRPDPSDSTYKDIINVAVGDTLLDTAGAKIVIFIDKDQEPKLAGLLEFEKYKKNKLAFLQVIIMCYPSSLPLIGSNYYEAYLKDSLGIKMDNFYVRTIMGSRSDYDAMRKMYFNQKPAHVFDYFAVLVDKDRHIRGYYDPTYISEVKRMAEEYKHLVLKDEHADMQQTNKIEQK